MDVHGSVFYLFYLITYFNVCMFIEIILYCIQIRCLSCMESSTLLQIILMACLYVVCQNCNKKIVK